MVSISTLLQFVFLLNVINSSQSAIPCANPQFEKVLGLRPPTQALNKLLYRVNDRNTGITTECLRRCRQNDTCTGFVLAYTNGTCYTLDKDQSDFPEEENEYDIDASTFWKTCYGGNVCNKFWTIERIPAATLIGNDTRKLPNAMTRLDCQNFCLNQRDFVCRSAKFHVLSENSLTPPQSYYYYAPKEKPKDVMGKCVLSASDRYLSPTGFRVSSYDEEYFENQCTNSVVKEFCAFEEYVDVILSHTDATYSNLTKQQCQKECEQFDAFKCRGFSLIPTQRMVMLSPLYTCLIHSENTKVFGPKSLQDHPGATYYEKAPCLNISVQCYEREMRVIFNSDTEFNGKLYMRGFSESPECSTLGNHTYHVELAVPLLIHKCGIVQVNGPDNRTLFSTTMIMQFNHLVQTHADRIIRVGCIFTNSSNILIGTGINFNNESDHNTGTNLVNQTQNLPSVEMRIIDLSSNEVGNTQIGDELQLIIEMKPANSGYDIWAGHLVAMTENGQDSILLLDDRGCPTSLDVFPGLSRKEDENAVQLIATFQAFKFSTSDVIRFSVMIQFCPGKCPKVECLGETFYNRIKRDLIEESAGGIRNLSRTQFRLEGKEIMYRMPLEFLLVVRNTNTNFDKLIQGSENTKILIAGYDYLNNEVCIDFSLLIGLVVLWILVQIILLVSCFILIRKYKTYYEKQYLNESLEELHKNFGLGFSNLEAQRRVHFDDTHVLT